MSTKAKRHIHKYRQLRIAGKIVWGCALPDCNHYMPAHMQDMVPGKASICWSCDKQIILDKDNMEYPQPLCNSCIKMLDTPHSNEIYEHPIRESMKVGLCTKCGVEPASPSNKDGMCIKCAFSHLGL